VPTSGAGALVRSLEALGVEVAFGIPGGAILPAYDPLYDSKVRHILVRHEQGAGHAATGYAQATGKVGVCIATSGPGATNLVTPIADAYMDSVPIVAITGQVARPAIGTDAFQEADIQGITLPITKHNFLVQTPEELPRIMAEAFHLAADRPARPGAGRHPEGRAAGADHVRLAADPGPARLPARPCTRTASRSARRPG
jgi:acetolactate synthase-1/2/3 large subunit